jgi:hypothetical protein
MPGALRRLALLDGGGKALGHGLRRVALGLGHQGLVHGVDVMGAETLAQGSGDHL